MPKAMRIEMISDVVCPWCVIGLRELERALARLTDGLAASLHFQPYELNPTMPREGQGIVDIYKSKFGKTYSQMSQHREKSRSRAENVGFTINISENTRIYNTFDAHRLLHWAELEEKQLSLKHALFTAHFTMGQNIADHDVLTEVAASVDLPADEAKEVLAEGRFTQEVRSAEQHWRSAGVSSVPGFLVDRTHFISGSQPSETFEAMLRQLL